MILVKLYENSAMLEVKLAKCSRSQSAKRRIQEPLASTVMSNWVKSPIGDRSEM